MVERRKLADKEIADALTNLTGWSLSGGKLHKEFKFKNFVEAFSFMTSVALVAEKMNHHPDWSNVYNRVTVDLITHDLGGIGTFDVEFATQIERLLAK